MPKKKEKKVQTVSELTVKITMVSDGDNVRYLTKEDWANNIKAELDADDCHVTELKNFTI